MVVYIIKRRKETNHYRPNPSLLGFSFSFSFSFKAGGIVSLVHPKLRSGHAVRLNAANSGGQFRLGSRTLSRFLGKGKEGLSFFSLATRSFTIFVVSSFFCKFQSTSKITTLPKQLPAHMSTVTQFRDDWWTRAKRGNSTTWNVIASFSSHK